MPKYRMRAQRMPTGAKKLILEWSEDSTSKTWMPLGSFENVPADVDIPLTSEIAYVRGHFVDSKGRRGKMGIPIAVRKRAAVEDRPPVESLVIPEPKVEQVGPAFKFVIGKPAGQPADEYEYEVRHSLDGDDSEDAVQVGFVDPGDEIEDSAWSDAGDQTLHTRPIRKTDGQVGPWTATPIKAVDTTTEDDEDHGDDFTAGTIQSVGSGTAEPLEAVGGGGVQFRTPTWDDFGTFDEWGPATWYDICGLSGTYETPVFELPEARPIMFEVFPEFDTITRGPGTWDDLCDLMYEPPSEGPNGEFIDNRIEAMAETWDGNVAPIVIEARVAVSDTASPTFTDADFSKWQPSKTYAPRAYAMRFTIYNYTRGNTKLKRIRLRRHCLCNPCGC